MAYITIQNLNEAFKLFYKPVVVDQMNTKVNPFLSQIEQSSEEVVGDKIRMAMRYGANGGIKSAGEDDDLPTPSSRKYKQAEYTTKNIFGTLRITEKAIAASDSSAGAFVKLLQTELEGLLTDAKINIGRQLFGDGTGKLATCAAGSGTTFAVDSTQYLVEGQIIDIMATDGVTVKVSAREITAVDRAASTITVSGASVTNLATDYLVISGSANNELTGLGAIFKNTGSIYGLDRGTYKWLIPTMTGSVGTISDVKLQKGLDTAEINFDAQPNFLLTSHGVRRAYQDYLEATKRAVNTMKLEGGWTSLTYNGLPFVADKFAPSGTIFMLIKEDFVLHQLQDWNWADRGGTIFNQTANRLSWNATLYKFCDLGNRKPGAQVKLYGITEA